MKCIVPFITIVTMVFGVTAELHEQYRISPGTKLEVSNINGDITIEGVEGNDIIIDIVKKTKKSQAELDKVIVDITSGETFRVETKYLEDNADVKVDITLKVPGVVIEAFVENVNGSVDIEGISADLNVENANGDINVIETRGTVDVDLANGDVRVEGDAVIQDIELANGNITAEVRTIPDDGIQFDIANGAIKVHILETLNADIEAGIVVGEIDVHDLAIDYTVDKKNVIRGTLNDGGPCIELEAATGSITLYRLKD